MENVKYSNILITGGSGFIGSHLTEKLLQYENVTITVVDNHFSCNVLPKEIEAKIRLEKIDIRNLADLERIFKVIRPEICFHLAAIHFIPYCIKHPNEVIDVNIKGTANIQHLCFKYGCNLIQASTADVYKQDENPHKENSLMKTTNIYGYTKKVNEDTLDFFFKERENELFGAKIRIFNAYGSRDTQPHVITEIINQIKNQKNQDLSI